MPFISINALKPYIRDARLQQLIDQDEGIVETAIEDAIIVCKDALYSRYNIDVIFANDAGATYKQARRWVIYLALYYIHERLPDKQVPDRVVKNYDDTLATLEAIEDAKKSTQLPLREDLSDTEGGNPPHKFRWGGNPEVTHI